MPPPTYYPPPPLLPLTHTHSLSLPLSFAVISSVELLFSLSLVTCWRLYQIIFRAIMRIKRFSSPSFLTWFSALPPSICTLKEQEKFITWALIFPAFFPTSHTFRRNKVEAAGPPERPLQALYCFKAEVILLLSVVETKAKGLLQARLCERKRTPTLFDSQR